MRQVDAARILGASAWTYITWEKHAAKPTAQFVPRIIAWLGYDPFPVGQTFGATIRWKRRKAGLTRRELGRRLGLSSAMIEQWERDVCKPRLENLRKLEQVIDALEISEDADD